MQSPWALFIAAENRVHAVLVRYSIVALRISLGVVFFAFGVLKYFPGVSPAQNLAETTTHILFFGLVPGGVALVLIATLECAIGLLLISGRGLRVALYLLILELLGILSPIVLLPGRLFAGPHDAPTWKANTSSKTSPWWPQPWSSPPVASAAATSSGMNPPRPGPRPRPGRHRQDHHRPPPARGGPVPSGTAHPCRKPAKSTTSPPPPSTSGARPPCTPPPRP